MLPPLANLSRIQLDWYKDRQGDNSSGFNALPGSGRYDTFYALTGGADFQTTTLADWNSSQCIPVSINHSDVIPINISGAVLNTVVRAFGC